MTPLHKQLQGHGSDQELRKCCQVFDSLLLFSSQYLCVSVLFAGCYKITTVFSHAQTVVLCVGCSTVLCQPTGGKARLTEGTGNLFVFHLK